MLNKKTKTHFLKRTTLSSILLLAILFDNSILSTFVAQNITINDSIKLSNGMIGFANFQFVNSAGNNLFHNDFYFQKNQPDSIDAEVMRALIYQGKYNNGLKNGLWTFEYDRLRASNNRFVKDLQIKQLASGERTIISANFVNGLAANEWTVRKSKVLDSKDVDSSFYARSYFVNHQFTGDFITWSDSLSITGQINESGRLHGEWAFRHKTPNGSFINEFREYDDGVLTLHAFYIGGDEIKITHYGIDETPDKDEEWHHLALDDLYFEVLMQSVIYAHNDKDIPAYLNHSNDFLKFAIHSFTFDNNVPIWNLQKSEKNISLPTAKLRKHTLDNNLEQKLKKSLEKIQKSQQKIDDFLKDPQVEINRYNSEEIAQYYSLFQLYNAQVNKLSSVLYQLNTPAFDYINREEILPKMLDEITFPTKVSYTFNEVERDFEHHFPVHLNNEALNLASLFQTIDHIHADIKTSHEQIHPLLERNKNQAQIALLEQQLVDQRDSVVALFYNAYKQENFNKLHLKYQVSVQNKVNQIFEDYSKKALNQRLETINSTLLQTNVYMQLYQQLVSIHEEMEYIEKEVYTRTVWNPYTFTDMDEIVKERVFNAYKNHLLPSVLYKFDGDMNAQQIEMILNELYALFSKMKELRNRDTKDLERALKRQSNPSIIAELLELKLEL